MKRSLREQVVRLRPVEMDEIVDMAKVIEEQEHERSAYHARSFQRTNSAPALGSSQRNSNSSPSKQSDYTPARKSFESTRDNKSSDQWRPIQNPCRYCGERYFTGHRYKSFQKYKCMEVEEVSEDDEDEEDEQEDKLAQKCIPEQELQVLSLKSMVGITTKRTMRMRGKIGETEMVVLVDSGASCSFIAKYLVDKLGLLVASTVEFGVAIGDGRVLAGNGKCEGVKLNIQGVEISEEYLRFEMGGTDLVLGYTWLEKLGETRINWGLHLLRFQVEDKWVTLNGDPDLLRAQASLNTMEKLSENAEEVILLELQALFESEEEQPTRKAVSLGIHKILKEFQNVFNMPSGLPPKRSREHAITLQAGTSPINIRPYRYSHYQKNEIKKLVHEMLQAGIIKPSISPFSSLVLLAKKKDRGFRFCVDYRAVNKSTIPD